MSETFITYYHSPVGMLKISGTEDYISEVSFYDKTQKKADRRKKHFPDLMIHCVAQLIEYFQGERTKFELPVHQEGTTFQQAVWSELPGIEYGKTISYLELAKLCGNAKASRAVAAATGKNKVAVIVPCHRAIGSNNDLIGYAGGLWRKKWLLGLEAKVAYGVHKLF